MSTSLTPTQHAVLAYAHQHTEGKIIWFPENIKGGARHKVLDGLFNRALITKDNTDCFIAAEGYDALGVPRKAPISVQALDAVIASATVATSTTPRTREHSKQATLIEMLKRPEGATLPQMSEVTQWQVHTLRGAMAGALKKKLGLEITSEKQTGSDRVYRISTTSV